RNTPPGGGKMEPKKKVKVKFVCDDEVVEHIIHIKDSSKHGKQGRKAKAKKVTYKIPSDSDHDDTDDDEDKEVYRPSEILSGQSEGLAGGDLYTFHTPKKSGLMTEKALAATKATTPASRNTPSKGKAKGQGTPMPKKKTGKDRQNRPIEATTPYRLRKRNETNADSSDESIASDSDSESVASSTSSVSISVKQELAKRISRKSKGEDLTTMVEDYFIAQNVAAVTSDRTLSKLDTPRMDQAALQDALSGVTASHKSQREELHREHTSLFNKWMLQMCNGYNLLLYGVGSKRSLIEELRTTLLKGFSHLVVNGYFPSLTLKHILNSITEDILDHRGNFRSPMDQYEFIKDHFETGDHEDLYLIVHNIDGAMLRAEKVQAVLSLLAQIQGFHIIASIDHINAPLIWDQRKSSGFNWLWYDVTTFEPYIEETSYENSLLVQQSGVLALSSLTHVMRSLTPNAKGIFLLLVRYQLDNKDNPQYSGMSFQDLYQKCREAFLVNSDQTLNTQLVEFKDHKLIRSKKNYDGVEQLMIPLDAATLNEFLDQQDDAS
ncbi:unnamed protein product, partial [Owenia fusiformis]